MEVMNVQTVHDLFGGSCTDNQKAPRPVFGNFLFENEIGILFGDSNTGKSILANDIAFFVAGGGTDTWIEFQSPCIPTMYVDLEMKKQQFVARYIGAKDVIPETYTRMEIDTLGVGDGDILAMIKSQIVARQAQKNAPKFIIIDNITNGFGNILNATKMKHLIFELKGLKDRFGLTFLLIAHCPKRKQGTVITADNLGGSKMIINFVDSAFAIAPSDVGGTTKYLKHIKCRATQKYDNVMAVEIDSEPYVHFNFTAWTTEEEQLTIPTKIHKSITPDVEAKIVDMIVNKKYSPSYVARILSVPQWAIYSYINQNDIPT